MRKRISAAAVAGAIISACALWAAPGGAAGGGGRVASPYYTLPAADPAPNGAAVQFMQGIEGHHPRLLFTSERIAALKKYYNSDAGKLYRDTMEGYLPLCVVPADGKTNHGWGQEVGLFEMPMVALHYVLTGDKDSFKKSMDYLTWLNGMDDWTCDPKPDQEHNSDTTASFTMVGAALTWDWLYNDLDPKFREEFRKTLWFHARAMYYGGHMAKNPGGNYWRGVPAYNHRWFRDWGLTLATLAAADGKADEQWMLGNVTRELAFMQKWLPVDGSQHEGPGYGSSAGALGLAFEVSDECLGSKLLDAPFFKSVAGYSLAVSAPGFSDSMYFADNFTHAGSMHPFFLKTAAVHRQADVMEGIRHSMEVNAKKFGIRDYAWLSILSDDPSIQGGELAKVPTTAFMPDLGLAVVRDGWKADSVAALFKCGPMGGYKANSWRPTARTPDGKLPYINVAHDHPDANSFTIFGDGQYMAETDRYPVKPGKLSSSVNTILINGIGQAVQGRLEGDEWQQPGDGDMTKMGVITALKDAGDEFMIEGEASGSYLAYTDAKKNVHRPALERFRRSFMWVKGGYILVLDDVRAPQPVKVTWLMEGAKLAAVDEAKGSYKLSKGDATCDFTLAADAALKAVMGESTANDHSELLGWQQLQASAESKAVRFASVFDPWGHGDLQLTLKREGADRAVVTVTSASGHFTDTWQWQAGASRFGASTIHGSREGGFNVEMDARCVPPSP